jgi:surface carbohydrate biosynthesis protein (TIGR04326 family)
LLVIADYVGSTTDSMLRLAYEARIVEGAKFEPRLRMHPTSPFIVDLKRHGDVRVDPRTLQESLAEADLVLASPTTSAVLDCIACGARVAVMRDPSSLDLAPVSRLPGVPTVTSAKDLVRALDDVDSGTEEPLDISRVLHLTPSLPRWKALMAELSARTAPSPRTTR